MLKKYSEWLDVLIIDCMSCSQHTLRKAIYPLSVETIIKYLPTFLRKFLISIRYMCLAVCVKSKDVWSAVRQYPSNTPVCESRPATCPLTR